MKISLLSIKSGSEPNTYDVTCQIGREERTFRFFITLLNSQVDNAELFVTSSDEFGYMFRYYPEAYGTAYQLVGRFHQGKPVEFPSEIGDYDVIL